MDFFNVKDNRSLILNREDNRCFYCLREINENNYVIEHIISRPEGDNSYRNVVAACRECNNRKGGSSAEDHLRALYRRGMLSVQEFDDRSSALIQVKAGDRKPIVAG